MTLQDELEEAKKNYWLDLADKAKETLSSILDDPDAPPAAVVSAAKEIFDRAYGKVAEKVELTGDVKLMLDMHRITGQKQLEEEVVVDVSVEKMVDVAAEASVPILQESVPVGEK